MELLKLKTQMQYFETTEEFANAFSFGKEDLILTNQFLYDPFLKGKTNDARVLFQENFGQGEPSDEMMNAILQEANQKPFDRIFAIGGGTVLDIAKLLVLKDLNDVKDAFQKRIPLIKEKSLIAVPTTCGTGSEVTNITIAEIKSESTKMGLATEELFPDIGVLIPEFLKNLPYSFYVYSSIDALIHASESYLSPKANEYTKLFSKEAIMQILKIYQKLGQTGAEERFCWLREILIASNFAGIAFGNAGVGAVHALSYPLGGKYHVPHGEANYQFFLAVFKKYQEKNPNGVIQELNAIFKEALGETEDIYGTLEDLLETLIQRKDLKEYGMKKEEIGLFAESVIKGQQRLLGNNYVPLSEEEIKEIYRSLYGI